MEKDLETQWGVSILQGKVHDASAEVSEEDQQEAQAVEETYPEAIWFSLWKKVIGLWLKHHWELLFGLENLMSPV